MKIQNPVLLWEVTVRCNDLKKKKVIVLKKVVLKKKKKHFKKKGFVFTTQKILEFSVSYKCIVAVNWLGR